MLARVHTAVVVLTGAVHNGVPSAVKVTVPPGVPAPEVATAADSATELSLP